VSLRGKWVGGLSEWTDEASQTAYLSVAFTWKLDEAWSRAAWYRAAGYRVVAGGNAFYTRPAYLDDVAEVPREIKIVEGERRLPRRLLLLHRPCLGGERVYPPPRFRAAPCPHR
jgi:hypothetical protein